MLFYYIIYDIYYIYALIFYHLYMLTVQ
jgi:hypothetical protein